MRGWYAYSCERDHLWVGGELEAVGFCTFHIVFNMFGVGVSRGRQLVTSDFTCRGGE